MALGDREFHRQARVQPLLAGRANPRDGVALNKSDRVDVGQRVTVEIGDHTARGPGRVADPRGLGRVGERAVAVVQIQPVGADVGDEDVGESVIVHVADGNALAVRILEQAGLRGDVGEAAVPEISIQLVQMLGLIVFLRIFGSLSEINVRPAVAVEIDHAHAAAVHLEHLVEPVHLRVVTVDELEGNPRGRRVILERHACGRRRSARRGAAATFQSGNGNLERSTLVVGLYGASVRLCSRFFSRGSMCCSSCCRAMFCLSASSVISTQP